MLILLVRSSVIFGSDSSGEGDDEGLFVVCLASFAAVTILCVDKDFVPVSRANDNCL